MAASSGIPLLSPGGPGAKDPAGPDATAPKAPSGHDANAPAGPHPGDTAAGWTPETPHSVEELTADMAPQFLPMLVKPMPGLPVVMDRDAALALRSELRSAHNPYAQGRVEETFPFSTRRLKDLNMAIKFVRKAGTLITGEPKVLSANLSHVGKGWMIPPFVKPGKGQYGYFDLCAKRVEIFWDRIAASLPQSEFDQLFEEDILKVTIDYSDGPVPRTPDGRRWWMRKTPDYDFHIWTRSRRLSFHPQSNGVVSSYTWNNHDDPFAPAATRRES